MLAEKKWKSIILCCFQKVGKKPVNSKAFSEKIGPSLLAWRKKSEVVVFIGLLLSGIVFGRAAHFYFGIVSANWIAEFVGEIHDLAFQKDWCLKGWKQQFVLTK